MRIKSNQLDLDDALVYFLTDHLGGTTVTLDEDGNRIAELRYTAWGETRYSDGTPPTQRKFNGQLEAEAGLYFFNARWLDPHLGRFAQADSIVPLAGSSLGWDRYSYTFGNPLKYNDPSGHCPWCVVGAIVGAAIGYGILLLVHPQPELANSTNKIFQSVNPVSGDIVWKTGFSVNGVDKSVKVIDMDGKNIYIECGRLWHCPVGWGSLACSGRKVF